MQLICVVNTGDERIYIPSRLEDNGLLLSHDPGYINRLKKSGPPWLVQAWLMGEWNATPEAEQMLTERISKLEGTAADLKSLPVVGRLMLFARGSQRPA